MTTQQVREYMPRLSNALVLHSKPQKNTRIELTSEEIAEHTAEYLANGGEIEKLATGVRRDV